MPTWAPGQMTSTDHVPPGRLQLYKWTMGPSFWTTHFQRPALTVTGPWYAPRPNWWPKATLTSCEGGWTNWQMNITDEQSSIVISILLSHKQTKALSGLISVLNYNSLLHNQSDFPPFLFGFRLIGVSLGTAVDTYAIRQMVSYPHEDFYFRIINTQDIFISKGK